LKSYIIQDKVHAFAEDQSLLKFCRLQLTIRSPVDSQAFVSSFELLLN